MSQRIDSVPVVRSLLAGNDAVADANARRFASAGVLALNLVASPGAGKTSLVTRTIQALAGRYRIAVVEGDIAGSIDAERVLAAGAVDAVQINTGGGCHLEAGMVRDAVAAMDLGGVDILFIENVGNLVCPTHWRLGEAVRVCVVSTPEGDDKPRKYPAAFSTADVIVLNKIDLVDYVDFAVADYDAFVAALSPDAVRFQLSCRSGVGIDAWCDWLAATVERARAGGGHEEPGASLAAANGSGTARTSVTADDA